MQNSLIAVKANAVSVQESIATLTSKVDVLVECTNKGKEVAYGNFEGPPPDPNYLRPLYHHGLNL